MAKSDIIDQLTALGFAVQEPKEGFISFPYTVESGKFSGKFLTIGFQIDAAFPMNPMAGGPHFNPQLLPITNGGGSHPTGGVHKSPLGDNWQYWSRPFPKWNESGKTVKIYMGHIKHLLDTV